MDRSLGSHRASSWCIAILLIWYLGTYNGLVRLQASTSSESWHNIDVQLQRRYDLIPNLVSRPSRATPSTSRNY